MCHWVDTDIHMFLYAKRRRPERMYMPLFPSDTLFLRLSSNRDGTLCRFLFIQNLGVSFGIVYEISTHARPCGIKKFDVILSFLLGFLYARPSLWIACFE